MSETTKLNRRFTSRLPESWKSKVTEQEWENACQQDCIDQKLDFVLDAQADSFEARERTLSLIETHVLAFNQHKLDNQKEFAVVHTAQNKVTQTLQSVVEQHKELIDWRRRWFTGKKSVAALVGSAIVFLVYDLVLKPEWKKRGENHEAVVKGKP